VLIPARDEEASIGAAVASVLANRDVELEVVVMDDCSRDRTADVVRELAAADPRVRLVTAPPLPPGWCGKQHACWRLAAEARHPHLLFLDADVRLAPDALARLVQLFDRSPVDLWSGVPHQRTGTLVEKLVVPLIHFLLLGYLPLPGVRWSRRPSFAAGCGQLFAARRDAYLAAGGHRAIRASRHDGLALPRAFRRAGLRTDLVDATDLASCRMYRSARELWRGFAKNATEGMASPKAIGPWTALLLGGQVAPYLLLAGGWVAGAGPGFLAPAAAGVALAALPRLVLAARFRQPLLGALLHPVGVLQVLAIQWYALLRTRTGKPVAWKGRVPA
jgi:glycosyltransferase involved in cell wall biosynthesis